MKKKLLVFAAFVFAVSLTGCTSFKMSKAQITVKQPKAKVIARLDKTVKVNKFIGASAGSNFLNITSDATDMAIYNAVRNEVEAKGGDAAINLKIEYKASFGNILCNGLTLGIWAPSKAHITGDIVKY